MSKAEVKAMYIFFLCLPECFERDSIGTIFYVVHLFPMLCFLIPPLHLHVCRLFLSLNCFGLPMPEREREREKVGGGKTTDDGPGWVLAAVFFFFF